MAVYRDINSNVKDIIDFIIQDDELKLLLNISADDALDGGYNPDSINIKDMIENHIYPYPNIVQPEDDAKSFVSIYMWNGRNAGRDNTFNRTAKIYVDIICHETLWNLKKGLIRPYIILDDLDTVIPNLDTDSIRGNLAHVDTLYIQYNPKFCGYRIIYEVTNGSRECFI